MDYSYYLKLRNSSAFKFTDILDANYKVASTGAYTFNKTNEATYAVTDLARMNAHYLPFKN
jgi:hypothetical protein